MTTSLKTCFKCGEEKDRGHFYAHSEMKDGLLGKCKECTRKDVRLNRIKKLKYYREYDRQRYMQGGHRYQDGPTKIAVRRGKRRYLERYREKQDAKTMVNNALRDGKLQREPCCVCGDPNSQAHHEDYSKPLTVVWLCPKHHAMHHKIIDRIAETFAEDEAV